MAGGVFSLWIYAVPVSATCTRLIINAGGNFPKPPLNWKSPKALLGRLNPLPQLLRRLRRAAQRLLCLVTWQLTMHSPWGPAYIHAAQGNPCGT